MPGLGQISTLFIMSIPSQTAVRCCRQLVRSSTSSSLRLSSSAYLSQCRIPSRRWQSTEAGSEAPANPKITQIVDQISQLTLLETAELVSSLKVGQLRIMLLLDYYRQFQLGFSSCFKLPFLVWANNMTCYFFPLVSLEYSRSSRWWFRHGCWCCPRCCPGGC